MLKINKLYKQLNEYIEEMDEAKTAAIELRDKLKECTMGEMEELEKERGERVDKLLRVIKRVSDSSAVQDVNNFFNDEDDDLEPEKEDNTDVE